MYSVGINRIEPTDHTTSSVRFTTPLLISVQQECIQISRVTAMYVRCNARCSSRVATSKKHSPRPAYPAQSLTLSYKRTIFRSILHPSRYLYRSYPPPPHPCHSHHRLHLHLHHRSPAPPSSSPASSSPAPPHPSWRASDQ
jgi:hypothetical protein